MVFVLLLWTKLVFIETRKVKYVTTTLESAREAFERSCAEIDVTPYGPISDFYLNYKIALKEHVPYKYRDIWKILDKKANQKPYQGYPTEGHNVLVIGAGPCGLRTAIGV